MQLTNIPVLLKNKIGSKSNSAMIARNSSWLMVERIYTMFLGLFVGIWVARYLGPQNYGILSFSKAFVVLFTPLASMGLNHIVTKEIVLNKDYTNTILGSTFLLRVLASLSCVVSITIGIQIVRPDNEMIHLFVVLLSLGTLFSPLQVIDFWFYSKMASKHIVKWKVCFLSLFAAIRVILILGNFDLKAFVIALSIEQICVQISFYMAYRFQNKSIRKWEYSVVFMKKLLRQSWPLILSGLAAQIYLKIDQIMLGLIISDRAVGIYSVAVRFSEVWYFIPNIFVSSAFAVLLNYKAKDESLYYLKMQKLLDYLFLFALSIAIITMLIANPLIYFLYGKEYISAAPVLTVHIWASLFIFMRALLSKWLIAEELTFFSLVTHLTGAIANVVFNLILIPRYTIMGAAVATLISYAFASYGALFFDRRTKVFAKMMTLSLFSPIRYLRKLLA